MEIEEASFANPQREVREIVLQIALVLVIGFLVVAYRVTFAISSGPGWDTYAFLSNAAEFAGASYGYSELHRPPFMSVLSALAFLTGAPMHESVIQWVDGALTLSGVLALYLLARRRTNGWIALSAGAMILAVAPLWEFLGSGYTDFPSVALSLWMLLACIHATDTDSRYFIVAASVFVLAVMTRYTALLTALPAFTWIMLRWRPFRQFKTLMAAFGAAVLTYLPAGLFYSSKFGDSLFPFVRAFGISEDVSTPGTEEPAAAAATWYSENVLRLFAPESMPMVAAMVLIVAALGLATEATSHLRECRTPARAMMIAALGVTPALLAQIGGAGLIVRQVTISLAAIIVWSQLSQRSEDGRPTSNSVLDATMAVWLLCYLDFHGHLNIQIPRYFVTMAPPLVYLVVLGWHKGALRTVSELEAKDLSSTTDRTSRTLVGLAGAALVAASCLSLAASVRNVPPSPNPYVEASKITADWLIDEGVSERHVVYSDLWPMTAWYTRIPVRAMPFFRDPDSFQHQLDKTSADYFITYRGLDFEGFDEADRVVIEGVDTIRLLKRVRPSPDEMPRILYLGMGWDRYLEEMTEYTFYLDFDMGRYGWEGSAFIDDPTLEDLQQYDAVTTYGMKWRSRSDGEQLLLDYVKGGGTLVVDASGNLSDMAYRVSDTVLFDMMVRRSALPAEADILVSDALAEFTGSDELLPELFVDEGGGAWYGASYEPLNGTPAVQVLARANGHPLVSMKSLGAGRIYFIAYNLVWHASLYENPSEQELIRAVFAHALESR